MPLVMFIKKAVYSGCETKGKGSVMFKKLLLAAFAFFAFTAASFAAV